MRIIIEYISSQFLSYFSVEDTKKSQFFVDDRKVSRYLPSLDFVLTTMFLLAYTSKDLYSISSLNFYTAAPLSLSTVRTNESSFPLYGGKAKKSTCKVELISDD